MNENNEEKALVPRLPNMGLSEMLKDAEIYIKSGLLPTHIKTPEAAVIIMQYGNELNIGPMQALNNIYVVGGKPALSGNLMSALIRKGGVAWQTIQDFEPIKNDTGTVVNYITTIKFLRDNVEEIVSYSWEEAKRAGLTTRDTWQKYPRNMLYWRCFSTGARRIASDFCMGMYLASEIAETENIIDTEDGEIKIIESTKK